MWIVWKKTQKPYIWDGWSRFGMDIGFILGNGVLSACGKNQQDSSTGLSTGRTTFYLVHILGSFQIPAHIWGVYLWKILAL
jgi:hypothetical protein